MIKDTQQQLRELRRDIDEHHKVWFEFAVSTAEFAGTESSSIPRRCSKTQRANVDAEDPEVYYRRVLTIPFVDHLIQEMEDRFSTNANVATLGLCLVPSVMMKKKKTGTQMWNYCHLFTSVTYLAPSHLQLNCIVGRFHKFLCWEPSKLPDSPIQALNECDNRLFPNISTLLRILCTIPVTSCEAERSFSALRRIKPFLRATMTKARLSGLTLLHVHQNIQVDLNDAVDCFGRKHQRKLQLL